MRKQGNLKMPTQIKICGITSLCEVEFINKMAIDYIGFVFAESKRKVSMNKACELSNALRDDIKKVGVFVDRSVDEINEIAEITNLDIAQVHKNYTQEMIERIDIPVWYAISVKDETNIAEANEASNFKNVAGIVSDSYVKGESGGTGKTFNWDLLSDVKDDVFLILAGGLNEDNICDAIKTAQPNIVDVSSGVEIELNGKTQKSEDKIFKLLRKVKSNGLD